VRVPGHDGLRGLLAELGHGLTATSANRSGGEPLLDPAEVAELLAGEDAAVVDGGRLPGGPPSTIVAIEGAEPVVVRTGSFPIERLRELLGNESGLAGPRER
jgi:L-threonylcarbamoyladenylate synthase